MSATWDSKSLKATPVSADEVLIIDTEDSRNQKRATLSSLGITAQNVVPINDITDFPAPVSGVITLDVNTMYEIRAPISTSDRFVFQNNTIMKGINSDQNSLTYTGTSTFFTATALTEDIQFMDMEIIATGTGATLFSLQGTSNPTVIFSGFTGFDNLGTLADFGGVLWREVTFSSFDTGVTFENTQSVILHTLTTIPNPGVSSEGGMIIFTGRASTFISVDAYVAVTISPVDIFDISPTVNAAASLRINNVRNLGTGDFFTTGSTASITAFANADPSSVAVTSVTDNSGVAVFTTTAVHGLTVEDVVVHTGFSEGTYNGTFVVSNVTSTTEYEVTLNGINVAFVATGTGTLQNKRVLVTSASHGLSADTPVLITDTINYDAGYNIKDILTNSFEIQAVFVITETGNWSTGSLIETEVRMDVSHSSPQKSSNSIGCVVLNENTTSTTVSTQNVFIDIVGNDTIVPASNIERWKLIDTDNGTIEYIGNSPYAGQYTGTFSVLSPGSQHYELRIVKQPAAGGGFSPLIDAIIVPFSTDSAAGTFPINVALTAVKGDQFKSEFQNIDGTDDMTFTNLSMGPVQ